MVDDLLAVRMGMRHRLQTERGVAGNQHIVDWLTFDTNATYFPEANRDNFGQALGLIDYDLRWYLGDRFTFLSDGFADVFAWLCTLANINGVDLTEAVRAKYFQGGGPAGTGT